VSRAWRLEDARQTLLLFSQEDQLAEILYWGARLPAEECAETLAAARALDLTGGMLDSYPPLSICPEARRSFPGHAGLVVRTGLGAPLLPRWHFDSAQESVQAENHALTLRYRDTQAGLRYQAHFALDSRTQVLVAQARLESAHPIYLDWLSTPTFPAPQDSQALLDFAGRWCGEFQIIRTPWSAGGRVRDNRTGRSGHEHFPALLVLSQGATNTCGRVYGFHYGWSGGHRMVAEELADGRRQVQFGHAYGSERTAQTHFQTAPLYAVFSDSGLNGCAVCWQRHLRTRILTRPRTQAGPVQPRPVPPRPVHYNCWEAIYFNHDLPTLLDIASRAANLGAEHFVLDDGWFGTRDDDTRALGDWYVDRRKYPDGLDPLIAHVHSLGMGFGLWLEPEMVSPDSDLYRAHPDWVLGPPCQIRGRQQMVLDLARPQVRDYLFARLSALLTDHAIASLKWDHNRVLPMPDAAQTRGTYDLLARLRAAFPKVEIETCASGGGRSDFGMLHYAQRVWLSDSNDALERLRIQHNAALFLPMVATGSHVGPRRCHTSGRVLDIAFRAWVAAQRHLGFELDPRELTAKEARVLRQVTQWWKDNRGWLARADILRLDSPDPAIIAEQQLAEDGSRFVVFAGRAEASAQVAPRPLPLTRLDKARYYRLQLLNGSDAPRLSRGAPALKSGGLVLSGAWLMSFGLVLPWAFPQTMWVIKGDRQ